eukprot:TRINITY_DN20887_c0_g1_i1.p2 TRINITY_DN20887_c0_g1~~TRINITY_DN20887_c0_g1_i1.p2  ORF type:complete len:449 (+),score=71.36 TRINITY_DN20887_c0_g1_i1:86-1432(+)
MPLSARGESASFPRQPPQRPGVRGGLRPPNLGHLEAWGGYVSPCPSPGGQSARSGKRLCGEPGEGSAERLRPGSVAIGPGIGVRQASPSREVAPPPYGVSCSGTGAQPFRPQKRRGLSPAAAESPGDTEGWHPGRARRDPSAPYTDGRPTAREIEALQRSRAAERARERALELQRQQEAARAEGERQAADASRRAEQQARLVAELDRQVEQRRERRAADRSLSADCAPGAVSLPGAPERGEEPPHKPLKRQYGRAASLDNVQHCAPTGRARAAHSRLTESSAVTLPGGAASEAALSAARSHGRSPNRRRPAPDSLSHLVWSTSMTPFDTASTNPQYPRVPETGIGAKFAQGGGKRQLGQEVEYRQQQERDIRPQARRGGQRPSSGTLVGSLVFSPEHSCGKGQQQRFARRRACPTQSSLPSGGAAEPAAPYAAPKRSLRSRSADTRPW